MYIGAWVKVVAVNAMKRGVSYKGMCTWKFVLARGYQPHGRGILCHDSATEAVSNILSPPIVPWDGSEKAFASGKLEGSLNGYQHFRHVFPAFVVDGFRPAIKQSNACRGEGEGLSDQRRGPSGHDSRPRAERYSDKQ